MKERRRFPRSPATCFARAHLDGGKAVECWVLNWSEDGALLRAVDGIAVPDRFQLMLDQDDRGRPARVAWRRMGEIGVSFESDPA